MADKDDKGRFVEGNSQSFKHHPERCNRDGRPKGRSLQDHLRKLIEDPEQGEKLCDALVASAVDRALKGDFKFWKEIMDRIDGKVPNINKIAGADGGSLTFILDEAVQSKEDEQE